MERRKVLFTDGMSGDFLLIITDAPKEEIEKYCKYHNKKTEEGGHFEMFDILKTSYYVKELLDSEIDEKEDMEIIGYDESYDFSQFAEKIIMDLGIGNGGHINMWNKGFFEGCSKAAGFTFNKDDYIIIGQFRMKKKQYEDNKEKFDKYMKGLVVK